MQDQRSFVFGQLERVQAMFSRVEGKASFLFAIDVAMLAALASNLDLKNIGGWHNGFALAVLLVLGVSLWKLYAAYAPSLDGASQPSMLYFRDIADAGEGGYAAKVNAASDSDLISDALSQIWRNSEILTRKFDRVQDAFTATFVAVPLWLIFVGVASMQAGRISVGQ